MFHPGTFSLAAWKVRTFNRFGEEVYSSAALSFRSLNCQSCMTYCQQSPLEKMRGMAEGLPGKDLKQEILNFDISTQVAKHFRKCDFYAVNVSCSAADIYRVFYSETCLVENSDLSRPYKDETH